MFHRRFHSAPLGVACALAFAVMGATAQVHAQESASIVVSLKAQSLGSALNQLANQAGLQLLVSPEVIAGRQAPALSGEMTARQALDRLLAGSGLVAEINGKEVVVRRGAGGASGEAVLAPVRVIAGMVHDATTEGSGSYAVRGSTLFKGAQALKDIPQSITVMTRQRMDDQGLDTLDEVLANTPGVTLFRRYGGSTDFVMRGFATGNVQYDGIPTNREGGLGNTFVSSTFHLDRVEVLRGAQGLLEGAGTPSGAINLVRKRGLAETAFNVEGRVGSWDNYGARLDAGGRLDQDGKVRGRAVLDYEDKGSFIDTLYERNLNFYGALDFDLSPDTTVGVGILHSKIKGNRLIYDGITRYADGRELGLPRSAQPWARWNDAKRTETQLLLDLEHRFGADWKLKMAGSYIHEEYEAINSTPNGTVPVGGGTVSGLGYSFDLKGRNVSFDANLSGKFEGLGIDHEIVLGANYARHKHDDAYVQYRNHYNYDVFDPRPDVPPLGTTAPTRIAHADKDTEQKGIYGMLRSRLTDRLSLILGGRASWYEYANVPNFTASTRMKEDGVFTPYLGAVYALTPQWSVYASYADIFQPQSVTDVNFQVLKPIVGTNYEAGIKGELFDGALNASLAVYRIDQENRGVLDYDAPRICGSTGAEWCSRAAGEVRSEGFDLEAHGHLTKDWQISGGYTYNRNKYLENDTTPAQVGKPFNWDPKHILRVWSDWQLPGGLSQWRIGAGVNYLSKQEYPLTTTQIVTLQDGYSIWNARVAYQIDKNWSAALNIDNLFDKHYYSYIRNYSTNYVGAPRNFLLTVRGSF
ncbi:TonB-dependent siderophore receptor [Thauera linaloolentis]|uniref:Outer membrane receptor for ferric coprogen and ferric-rhodotorulic acid n=1 Tax=Thauera linaloolentis (strain DSM 12138 / JCM 21573 / CCUG 41526 / CIP 105981 / IAM 15112 / NBRC 102519 / 47Lol) TaxID=1123367 RepID=N6Z4S7_THAL4|nr:TonB-dependent receptor [Thauera linaloolentis]ENO87169.1 outer membrane receptor for ferric coprogen and ferric-rhodotorulic acid [Thauera linaloolentis 47Lol = DSM 12138]MCM8566436.1 TonB-dependent receptor [Thauera linaloolentis]